MSPSSLLRRSIAPKPHQTPPFFIPEIHTRRESNSRFWKRLVVSGFTLGSGVAYSSDVAFCQTQTTPHEIDASPEKNRIDATNSQILKLLIIKKLTLQMNMTFGPVCQTYLVVAIGDDEYKILHSQDPLQKKYNQLHIIYQIEDSKGIHVEDTLSEQCKKTILDFASKGRPIKDYCCTDFLTDSYGLYSDQRVNHISSSSWRLDPLDEAALAPGDGITILDKDKTLAHYAIYLIDGVYLSVFGKEGPLVAATLDEMMEAYNGEDVAKITKIDQKDDLS